MRGFIFYYPCSLLFFIYSLTIGKPKETVLLTFCQNFLSVVALSVPPDDDLWILSEFNRSGGVLFTIKFNFKLNNNSFFLSFSDKDRYLF